MKRLWLFGVVVSAATACKTANSNTGSVKEIESVKKVSMIQGNDAQGNAVAFITCAEGWIDKTAKKSEFAVPFNKVAQLSYPEMEQIYCTESSGGGTVVVGPGPGPGSGPLDANQIDPAQCKSQENVDLPNIAAVKRVYVPANVTDSYDRCIVFGYELEQIFAKLTFATKTLIDKKIRVYATQDDKFSYDAGAKKLTIPLQIKDKMEGFLSVVAPIAGGTTVTTKIFPSNKGLIFTFKQGGSCFADAVSYCKSLGAPWVMPAREQLATVSADLNAESIQKATGSNSGNFSYIWVRNAANSNAYSNPPFSSGGDNYSNCDMSACCIIDATN